MATTHLHTYSNACIYLQNKAYACIIVLVSGVLFIELSTIHPALEVDMMEHIIHEAQTK